MQIDLSTLPDTVKTGKNVIIHGPVNIYGYVELADNVMIGAFCEIQGGDTEEDYTKIGENSRIQSHSFICQGVTIGKNCFISHGTVFSNDSMPRCINKDGSRKTKKDWKLLKTIVEDGASIGNNVTVLGGIKIGAESMCGAGSVLVKSVPKRSIVVGNPAVQIHADIDVYSVFNE